MLAHERKPGGARPPGHRARAAYTVARRLARPRAYATVGSLPQALRAAALTKPHFRETLRWAARKPYAYLAGLGLVTGPG